MLQRIKLKLKPKEIVLPLGEWACDLPVILDGKKFSFKDHEYLRAIYADPHPHIALKKAAQMGLTSFAMLKAIYGARYKGLRGIGYFFSARQEVLDFSRGRFSPLIQENEVFQDWVRETDSSNLKAVWNSFIYFRGLRSRAGLKSIPLQAVFIDELDEAQGDEPIEMVMERMSHAENPEITFLSNPSLPSFGISKLFEATDQRYWLIRCGCGEWNNLVQNFIDNPPGNLKRIDKSHVIRACLRCGNELDIQGGEWIARKPEVTEKRGYQISQLFSAYVSPQSILEAYETATERTTFFNLKIGVEYVDAQNKLQPNDLYQLCSDEGMPSSCSGGGVVMGIDIGLHEIFVVVSKMGEDGKDHIQLITIIKTFEELDHIFENYHVSLAIIDAQPEGRSSRAFCERHKGRAFMCYYSEHVRGDIRFDEENLTVIANRTESLDMSHFFVVNKKLVLPRRDEITNIFIEQCCNVAKRLEEDEMGNRAFQYLKLGADHGRHALTYALIGRARLGKSLFADSDFAIRED